MSKPNFPQIVAEAVEAANKAGDEWMEKALARGPQFRVMDGKREVGQMLDVCGIVFLQVKDGRTAFARWLKAQGDDSARRTFNHKYSSRQEWGLGEACEYAILNVLTKNGIKGVSVYSRID